jgi:hypothetical protein
VLALVDREEGGRQAIEASGVPSQTGRARFIGAALLLVAFISGAMAGSAWTRARRQGISVDVRMTTALPRELRRLDLSPAQEKTLGRILLDGQRRTLRVLRDLEPRLRATMDSVDAEIHTALTTAQRESFDSARRGRSHNVFRQELDTVQR